MIIKGLWRLDGFYIDTGTTNIMNSTLQYYDQGNNCCQYKMDFQDNNIVFGYYLTYDTFNYVKIGKWELRKYNELYVQLDEYVDGVFTIKKEATKKYKMTSDENYIKAFTPLKQFNPALKDTVKCTLKISRL